MKEIKVTVEEMLCCRDRRVHQQNLLLMKYHCPVISFCMNIPGPVKTSGQIRKAFDSGTAALLDKLKAEKIGVMDWAEFHDKTGDELLLAVSAPADRVKKLTTEIEEGHSAGRLFDMDVIGTDGRKLSRNTFRRCLICGRQAQDCARSRRHSLKELEAKVQEILDVWGSQSI